ncbi:MAG: hypothetical protein ACRDNX_08900 [Gaiellaceae bacterium]
MAKVGVNLRRFLVASAATLAMGALLAVSGFAGTGDSGGVPAPASFRLANGSAGCSFFDSGEIGCRTEAGPSALVLEPDGDSRPADVFVGWDETTPVLLSGESWWHGDVVCRAGGDDVTCSTETGGEIVVGARGAGGLAPPVEVSLP